jgi:nucleotide-binding universal stress UspA family protein
MIEKVLVPLDGSLLAERALPYAMDLARATGARLTLLRVTLAPALSSRPEAENDATAYLKVTGDVVRAEGLEVETRIYHRYLEDVGQAVTNYVREQRPDLIVMSTHGRGGLGRLLYGSVADGVMRQAMAPVLLITAGCERPWPSMHPPRILVPLDGSEFAEDALQPACELLSVLGGELLLVQVIEPPTYAFAGDGFAYAALDLDEMKREGERYLEKVSAGLRAEGKVVREVVEVGFAPSVIAEVARDRKADLVAMATHGRGGLARVVLGSVTTGLLHKLNLPLLLVRPVGVAPVVEPAEATEQEVEQPMPEAVERA